MRFALLFVVFLLLSQQAFAGVFEIGFAGSYRKSNIDVDAYDESSSLTGSLSYYFDEMSALELSYTDGSSKRFIGSTTGQSHTQTVFYSLLGLDFVLTFGDKGSTIRPYAKAGAAYIIKKRLVDQYEGFDATIKEDPSAVVPSAGLGVKISLTQMLSLKLGVEAWTSRSIDSKPMQIDYMGRAGLSWMF